tara:strand:- start:771 stop:1070 length:300 start_codon:yes stop_codon:yes gene_type:complete
MTKLVLIILFLVFYLIVLYFSFFNSKRNKRALRKKIIIPSSKPSLKEEEFNPDMSTDDWDLHKIRLEKFRRSKYKELNFFLSSENRIYYLSEKGAKVYC